jgi:hypothetical protein
MSPKLDRYLVLKYPKLFVNRYKDMKETAMIWGFDHSDGWFWLIDNLCSNIQSYIDSNNKPQVTVDQVKEKFGGLCFYYHGGDETIHGMVRFAESLSYHICEKCGSTKNIGKTIGWITTLCEDCSKIQKNPLKWKRIEEDPKFLRKIKLDTLNNLSK